MSKTSYRRLQALFRALLIFPFALIGILLTWMLIDFTLGSIEVAHFIQVQRPFVARRLADPQVHTYSLRHAPGHWETLQIEIDVENRATFERLETDLEPIYHFRFPPRWNIIVRSREELDNDFGAAAAGIGEVFEFFHGVLISAGLAAATSAVYLVIRLRELHPKRVEPDILT